eukprot:gnl/MRDRNA2_/MRDRNA2_102660_c0_seq1.p1 gnl/MRDRNA2_/MRDRNA2_102660_c0~~gnl/MRDRNA2_/MRDRNA2_102660_c0_seq1.p1  ORF type:complete len:155 (+),score=41.42 gnl/MRDRNA2_/MRDRNA2_102660_c0_seq1:61-525(+)
MLFPRVLILNVLVLCVNSVALEKFLDASQLSVHNRSHHNSASLNVLPKLFDSGRVQRTLDAADAAEKSVEAVVEDGKNVAKEAREKNNAAFVETQQDGQVERVETALSHAAVAEQAADQAVNEAVVDEADARQKNAAELNALAQRAKNAPTRIP